MVKTVNINVTLVGPIATMACCGEVIAPIHSVKAQGIVDIVTLVKDRVGNHVLFAILINGCSIDLWKEDVFTDMDEITIIPVVLGG